MLIATQHNFAEVITINPITLMIRRLSLGLCLLADGIKIFIYAKEISSFFNKVGLGIGELLHESIISAKVTILIIIEIIIDTGNVKGYGPELELDFTFVVVSH